MPDDLQKYEDNWETSMGAWFPGEKVTLRGKDVLAELRNYRWHQYLLYGVTGKKSERIARLFEGIWLISCSFPDPRLWNNRVAALAATARSTGVLASSGALAVTEATIYGLKPIKGAMDFLYRTMAKIKSGQVLEDVVREELKKYRNVYGYGRPITDRDERVAPLMEFAHSLDAGHGEYTQLAFKVDEYLSSSRYGYTINISGVAAALMADEGYSPDDHYHLATLAFTAGVIPCFIDASKKPEGAFFPLRTTRINYEGTEQLRVWGK